MSFDDFLTSFQDWDKNKTSTTHRSKAFIEGLELAYKNEFGFIQENVYQKINEKMDTTAFDAFQFGYLQAINFIDENQLQADNSEKAKIYNF